MTSLLSHHAPALDGDTMSATGIPEPSLLPADSNTGVLIIDLLATMPAGDQDALLANLFDRPARQQAEAVRIEESLAQQPVEVLRSVRDRMLTDVVLRQYQLGERDAC